MRRHPDDPEWLTNRVAICLQAPAACKGLYIAPGAAVDAPCTLSTTPHYWHVRLAELPVIDASPATGRGGDILRAAPSAESLPPAQLHVLYKLLRAHLEVGACQVVGHGIKRDLFGFMCRALGTLPDERLLEPDGKDRKHKVHYELMTEYRGQLQNHVASLGYSTHAAVQMAYEYLTAVELFSDTFLHTLALGQQMVQGKPAPWRYSFQHDRALSLRLLQYYPGEPGVRTTCEHVDHTFVTVLDQDSCGGLLQKPTAPPVDSEATKGVPDLRTPIDVFAVKVVPGALLCNAGSRLEAASASFYRGGVHWVVREAATAGETRFSMPFFYDRHGGPPPPMRSS